MVPVLTDMFGNPSAKTYKHGWEAMSAVNQARSQVSQLINASSPSEIIFTSGATECNGMAIRGIFENLDHSIELHLITSRLEHSCVLEAAKSVELDPRGNVEVTYLGVPQDGVTRASAVASNLRKSTVLVSIMMVNNEIGVVNEIEQIGALCHREGVLFHVDAAQGLGKLPIDVQKSHIDLMSMSSHKLYGPKGVGALYVREDIKPQLAPLLKGGGQEGGLRGGTHNMPGIVGFGAACKVASEEMASEIQRLQRFRDELLAKIRAGVSEVEVNGSMQHRVAGNLSLSFPGVDGEALLTAVNRRLAVSSGSACKAASGNVSHVMGALGVPQDLARATLRFGLGRTSTERDIAKAADIVIQAVSNLYSPCIKDDAFTKHKDVEHIPASKDSDVRVDEIVEEAINAFFSASMQDKINESIGFPSMHATLAPIRSKHRFERVQPQKQSELDKLAAKAAGESSSLEVVGYVSNQYETPLYIEWKSVESRIKVRTEWAQALDGVTEYSHLIIVWVMNLSGDGKKSHVPQGLYESVPKVGIFSCRCPQRPNPIAMTTVKLNGLEGLDTLVVQGLDAVNGSPVIDIKPYDPKWDDLSVARPGEEVSVPSWTDKLTY